MEAHSPTGAEVPDNLVASLGEAICNAKVVRKHALSVFEVNKCRVSQSTVSSWGKPNMSNSKSSARRTSPRERKIRHPLFLLFSKAVSFLFSSYHFLYSFLFLASDVVDLVSI